MGRFFREAKHLLWYNPDYDEELRDDWFESESSADEGNASSSVAEWSKSSGIITGTENESTSNEGKDVKQRKRPRKNPDLFQPCQEYVEAQVNVEGFDVNEKRRHQRIPFSWPPEEDRRSGLVVRMKKQPPKEIEKSTKSDSRVKELLATLLIEGLAENVDLVDSKLKDILSSLQDEGEDELVEPPIQFRKPEEMDVPFVIHLEAQPLSNDTGLGCPSTWDDEMRGDGFGSLQRMYSSKDNASAHGLEVWVKTTCLSDEITSSRDLHSVEVLSQAPLYTRPESPIDLAFIHSVDASGTKMYQDDVKMQELLRKSGSVVPRVSCSETTSGRVRLQDLKQASRPIALSRSAKDSIDDLDFEKVKELYGKVSPQKENNKSVVSSSKAPAAEIWMSSSASAQDRSVVDVATASETTKRQVSSKHDNGVLTTRAEVDFEKVKVMYDNASASGRLTMDQPESSPSSASVRDPSAIDVVTASKTSNKDVSSKHHDDMATNRAEVDFEKVKILYNKASASRRLMTSEPKSLALPNDNIIISHSSSRHSMKRGELVLDLPGKEGDEEQPTSATSGHAGWDNADLIPIATVPIEFPVEEVDRFCEGQSTFRSTPREELKPRQLSPHSVTDTATTLSKATAEVKSQQSSMSLRNSKVDDLVFEEVKKLYDGLSKSRRSLSVCNGSESVSLSIEPTESRSMASCSRRRTATMHSGCNPKKEIKPIEELELEGRNSPMDDRSTPSTTRKQNEDIRTEYDTTALSHTPTEEPKTNQVVPQTANSTSGESDFEGVKKLYDKLFASEVTARFSKEDDSPASDKIPHESMLVQQSLESLSKDSEFEVVKKLYDKLPASEVLKKNANKSSPLATNDQSTAASDTIPHLPSLLKESLPEQSIETTSEDSEFEAVKRLYDKMTASEVFSKKQATNDQSTSAIPQEVDSTAIYTIPHSPSPPKESIAALSLSASQKHKDEFEVVKELYDRMSKKDIESVVAASLRRKRVKKKPVKPLVEEVLMKLSAESSRINALYDIDNDSEEESRDPTHYSQSHGNSERDMVSSFPAPEKPTDVPLVVYKKPKGKKCNFPPTDEQTENHPGLQCEESIRFHDVEIETTDTIESFF